MSNGLNLFIAASLLFASAPYAQSATQGDVAWKASLVQGENYLAHKQLDKAEDSFRAALKEIKRSPHSPQEMALCLESLAKTIYMEDQIYEPIPLYKKALKQLQKAYGKNALQLVPDLLALGDIFENEGDYKKALKFYNQALTISSNNNECHNLICADCMHRIGRVYVKQDNLKDAEENFLGVLSIVMEQKNLPSTDFLEDNLIDYISLLLKTEYNASLRTSVSETELLKDKLGVFHKKEVSPEKGFSTGVSASLADRIERGERPDIKHITGITSSDSTGSSTSLPRIEINPIPGRASDFAALQDIQSQRVIFYERLIETDIKSLGPDHPSVARDLTWLAYIFIAQKNYDKARPLLLKARDIYTKIYSSDPGHDKLQHVDLLLALISEEQNPQAATIDVSYLKSLPLLPEDAKKLEVALRLNDLAFMLYCQNKTDKSLKVYYWALASLVGACGDRNPLSACCMLDMSKLLRLSGRGDEATKLEGSARAIARKELIEKRSQVLP